MKLKIHKILFVVLILPILVLGQGEEREKSQLGSVAKEVVKDVVYRVLVYNFKPRTKKKRILLADRIYFSEAGSTNAEILIDETWLPKIRNIDFQLQSPRDDEDIYFFKEWDDESHARKVLFGYGHPACSYSGNVWIFRVIGSKSRLWLDGGAGGGCSHGSATR